jgi:hypothetical protein
MDNLKVKDIWNNRKATLSFVYAVDIKGISDTDENCVKLSVEEALLYWCQTKTVGCQPSIEAFSTCWQSSAGWPESLQ